MMVTKLYGSFKFKSSAVDRANFLRSVGDKPVVRKTKRGYVVSVTK